MSTSDRAPVLFIPHGGGPLPLLGDPGHQPLVDFLKTVPERYPPPKAILVVSAHWEAPRPTLLGDESPGLYFDYYGFPPESYRYAYPAVNPSSWRTRLREVLAGAGLEAAEQSGRGYDHGVFVPLMLMHPAADIPVLQLSLVEGLDPVAHFELGRALAPLRDEGVMVLGSGLSFHNLRLLLGDPAGDDSASQRFHGWLVGVLGDPALTDDQRYRALADWTSAPDARTCHPREEHLLPLHLCLGAAGGRAADIVFDEALLGQRTIGALWR
ncbi:DODA-type extradiol aromatic ring-opening family dioxygenase [Saccharospirillum salsuginis]|uniref:Dioxygenase n=1 Tax=Saccharospirillum salsuginis TaxID=418750 RepID=A0A918KN81_9GAMM|nr:class III extradiol ring-cleavage dioxygenase [Saccharospirillum salsuginis]GGX67440.1 dioxygenase [Saccharospirillum salsuginis]